METIETARLLLRPFDHGDAPRVLDILSRIDVIRWLGNPPFVPMPDLDAARAWIDRWHDREDMPRHWARAVVVKETGVMAGTVLVAPMERIDGGYVGEHEVGWHLHPDSVGRSPTSTRCGAACTPTTHRPPRSPRGWVCPIWGCCRTLGTAGSRGCSA
jgi:RimJ/RimL family protein N-acetyltransferase